MSTSCAQPFGEWSTGCAQGDAQADWRGRDRRLASGSRKAWSWGSLLGGRVSDPPCRTCVSRSSTSLERPGVDRRAGAGVLGGSARWLRPHPAAGRRGRAERARRHDDLQGRDRRRRRAAARDRLLQAGPRGGLQRDPRPVRARGAGRRRHRRRRADQARRDGPHRGRALPAHADLDGPHCGQRRVLRQDRAGARGAAQARRGGHAHRPARLRDRGRRRRRDREQRAGRGVRRHRAARVGGLPAPGGRDRGHGRRDRGGGTSRRGHDRRAHRVRRPRPADERAAPRADDRPGRAPCHRQGARGRHPAGHPDRLDHDGRRRRG